jgi:hypothetical protein
MNAAISKWKEVEQLDHMVVKMMRKRLGEDGGYEHEGGRRQCSNIVVGEFIELPKLHSEFVFDVSNG